MSTCVIPGRPHQADAGLLLCRHHLDLAAEWLHDIEREVDNLDARPSMQVVFDQSGGGLASQQSPVRLDAVVHRDRRRSVGVPASGFRDTWGVDDTLSAYDLLHGWARTVRDGRGLEIPVEVVVDRYPGKGTGPFCRDCQHISCLRLRWRHKTPRRLDVHSERLLLTRHLEWAATQPWIDDMVADLRKLRGQLLAANGNPDPKPLGRCPQFDEKANECGGKLWPVTPKHSSGTIAHAGNDVVQAVECDRDQGHRWEGLDLLRLIKIVEDEAQEAKAS